MLENLDPSQRQFCEAPEGNIRLLAPAGCGKTLSLLFRCAYLAEKAKPQRPRFLVVTFTVAAKQELLSRLNEDSRFATIRDNVEITTLNSWGYRRIKNASFSPKLVTSKDEYHYTMKNALQPIWKDHEYIKGAIEQKSSMAPRKLMDQMDAFKSVGFDHVRQTNYESFAERLSQLRSQGLEPKISEIFDELVKFGVLTVTTNNKGEERVQAGDRKVYSAFFQFWRDATKRLIETATFTLEDQKYFAYLDERQKLDEGKYLSGAAQYNHVLIDEFQDINPLDLALLKAIAERNRATITIVGDDDQAIFEWRGATPEYILNPARFFEAEFKTFTLATNYRSPSNIVRLSQRLIANNNRRIDKAILPHRTDDARIEIRKTTDLNEALDLVYDEVKSAISQGQSPSRVAIVGRKRSQLIPYQIFFASKDVSFCAAEDLQVFMSQAFDRLLRLMMIKSRRDMRQMRSQVVDDMIELCNLIKRYPLSKIDRESLRKHLNQSGVSTVSGAIDALASYRGSLKGANPDGRINIAMADAIRHFLDAQTVSDSLVEMGNKFEGLQVDLGKAVDDIFYADPPFFYLAEYATRYKDDYLKFVEDIEQAKDQLTYLPPFEDDAHPSSVSELWKRPIHLMTALRAKGKEFDTVILLDVNDGIWPNKNARTPEQKEAERRVFYVAFTRAKKRVLILFSGKFGNRAGQSRYKR
ncbi:MAG: UvrD-helicase domain-containing protein [Blastocatellales bacterium]